MVQATKGPQGELQQNGLRLWVSVLIRRLLIDVVDVLPIVQLYYYDPHAVHN
jgi:hypothetical protein